jgi:hypothetical protein
MFRLKALQALFAGGMLWGSGPFVNCDGRTQTLFLSGYTADGVSGAVSGAVVDGLGQAAQNVVDGFILRFVPPPPDEPQEDPGVPVPTL